MPEVVHFLDVTKDVHPARTWCGLKYMQVGSPRIEWTQIVEDVTCVDCRAGRVDEQLAPCSECGGIGGRVERATNTLYPEQPCTMCGKTVSGT